MELATGAWRDATTQHIREKEYDHHWLVVHKNGRILVCRFNKKDKVFTTTEFGSWWSYDEVLKYARINP